MRAHRGPKASPVRNRIRNAKDTGLRNRRLRLHLAATWPWATQLTAAITPSAGLRPRLTSRNRPCDQERTHPRARGTPPTQSDSRAARHSYRLKVSHPPQPQPDTSRSRNIEVRFTVI
jgi:hypothetical protein